MDAKLAEMLSNPKIPDRLVREITKLLTAEDKFVQVAGGDTCRDYSSTWWKSLHSECELRVVFDKNGDYTIKNIVMVSPQLLTLTKVFLLLKEELAKSDAPHRIFVDCSNSYTLYDWCKKNEFGLQAIPGEEVKKDSVFGRWFYLVQ